MKKRGKSRVFRALMCITLRVCVWVFMIDACLPKCEFWICELMVLRCFSVLLGIKMLLSFVFTQ